EEDQDLLAEVVPDPVPEVLGHPADEPPDGLPVLVQLDRPERDGPYRAQQWQQELAEPVVDEVPGVGGDPLDECPDRVPVGDQQGDGADQRDHQQDHGTDRVGVQRDVEQPYSCGGRGEQRHQEREVPHQGDDPGQDRGQPSGQQGDQDVGELGGQV